MAAIEIPASGLSLKPEGHQNYHNATPPAKTQILRLNLAQNTLDELVDSLQNDQKARIRLGKHQTILFGNNKSQQLFSSPTPQRSELYVAPSSDKENMYFSGVLSHNLEVEKAKEATASTDEALADLQQSMSAFERGKESKKTQLLSDIREVRALGAGDNRSSNGKKAALLARMPTSKIDVEKERFFKGVADRSLPASPLLGGSKSPSSIPPITPTSAPLAHDKEKVRLDALRTPFIHLLAIRSVSVKYLAQQTRSSLEDCQSLAKKFGVENRLNREKFDLKDKSFKDLDVWNFPYPSEDDRQEAINNAISAFDRMRISRSDKLWQMLLPKNERGKGKVLSRLNLTNGPMKKSVTPRINVQPSEDTGKEGYGTGNETDRTNGATTPNPGDLKPPARTTGSAQKKKAGDKEAAKRAPTKSKNNTTLTGKVTKKADKKAGGKPDGKFKSAEYVNDSDEDVEMEDVPAPTKQPEAPEKAKAAAAAKPAKAAKAPEPKTTKPKPTPPNPKVAIPSTEQSKPTKGLGKELPSEARGRSDSAPRKPSPLGSSPPTNASDLEKAARPKANSSSSSSSPLITQRQKEGAAKTKLPAKPNGVNKAPPANSLKRKAEAAPSNGSGNNRTATNNVSRPATNGHANGTNNDPKRRRVSSVSDPVSSCSSSGGSISPPLGCERRRRELQEKSRLFKVYYARYRALHEEMSTHPNPPTGQVEKLERQHVRLQKMKKEIWDEDRKLSGMRT